MDRTFTQILEDVELSRNNSNEKQAEVEPSQKALNFIRQFARAYKVCQPKSADLPAFSMMMN
ncbi:MAG: hypothetical protein J6Y37_03260 [Paludibacteraceae bacterium]|nr:hypothetical protein [Paludibacteraceae bacterium]